MNKKTRLIIYKKALVDYKIGAKLDTPSLSDLNTEYGFCVYFDKNFYLDVYNNKRFKKTFPELYKQRKTPEDYSYHYDELGDCKRGLKFRIKALKAAIKILEQK